MLFARDIFSSKDIEFSRLDLEILLDFFFPLEIIMSLISLALFCDYSTSSYKYPRLTIDLEIELDFFFSLEIIM